MEAAVKPHVLIVEDEPKIASALADYVRAAGYRASVAGRGDVVPALVAAQRVDAILLDLMLPGMDGLDVCCAVRATSQVPILMLTARVEEVDRLLGLELGADDYICKPFSLREVVSRLRAVLRRSAPSGAAPALPFSLDADRHALRVGSRDVALTPVEFRLLACLCERPGRILSRQRLLDAAYVDHRVVSDRTVDSHIRNLRRKFEALGLAPIASIYGVGFRLDLE